MKKQLVNRIMEVLSCEKELAKDLAQEQISRQKFLNPALSSEEAIDVLINTL